MAAITTPVTVNGWVNLGTALRAAGYTGGGNLSQIMIYNPSATVPVYIHFTNNGSTNPTTGTDGMPILTSAPSATFTADRGSNQAGIDIGTTWLFTASSISIKIAAFGV